MTKTKIKPIDKDKLREVITADVLRYYQQWLDGEPATETALVAWLETSEAMYYLWLVTDAAVKRAAQVLDVDVDTLAPTIIDVSDITEADVDDDVQPSGKDLVNYLMAAVPYNLADHYGYDDRIVDDVVQHLEIEKYVTDGRS